jgi:hypothetical protein
VREAAPAPVLARRAAFAASASGKAALLGDKELVEEVSSGAVSLDAIAPEALPEPMQRLSRDEQRALIAKQAERRADLQQQIEAAAAERSAYLILSLMQKPTSSSTKRQMPAHMRYTAAL